MRSPWLIHMALIAAGLGALLGSSTRVRAEEPNARSDARLTQAFSVEVRAADLGEVVARLAKALGVRMDTQPEIGGRRITAYASKASLFSVQQSTAALFHTRWSASGTGAETHYQLLNDTGVHAQADRLRLQRRQTFLTSLMATEASLRTRDAQDVTDELRESVNRRLSFLPPKALDELSPDFVRQASLLAPLRLGMLPTLQREGSVWASFRGLPLPQQELLASFVIQRFRQQRLRQRAADRDRELGETPRSRPTVLSAGIASGGSLGPAVLDYPQARMEYRLLHGDRWTGSVLQVRVGASDNWTTAILPSVLYDIPDYASLYPEARQKPGELNLEKNLNVRIDTETMNWDQALTAMAKTAGINVMSDSYPRPSVFRPSGPGPILIGTTVRETLDKVSQYYGYVWWRYGDFYLFRHRLWAEEERVAVPQRVLQSIGANLTRDGALSNEDLTALAGLTDEQLLSMHLYGRAASAPYAPQDAFDLNQIQIVRAALLMAAQMDPQQLRLARDEGIPYSLMSPVQQFIFGSMVFDRGIVYTPQDQDLWVLRLTDDFKRERTSTGGSETGALRILFDFGSPGVRTATLAIRAPVVEAAPAAPPTAE